jgi:hypothetical protein
MHTGSSPAHTSSNDGGNISTIRSIGIQMANSTSSRHSRSSHFKVHPTAPGVTNNTGPPYLSVEANEPLAEIGEQQEMEANEQDSITNHGGGLDDDRQHSVSSPPPQEIQQLEQQQQSNNNNHIIHDDSSSS